MSILTAEAVMKLLTDCLFDDGDPRIAVLRAEYEATKDPQPSDPSVIFVDGITAKFFFPREKIEEKKDQIIALLAELPDEFRSDGPAKGWSFLNACDRRDGSQWGEHANMEALVVLGIAAGVARWLLPRDMWSIFPGGMPYFSIDVPQVTS